jgi:hypothetical protein
LRHHNSCLLLIVIFCFYPCNLYRQRGCLRWALRAHGLLPSLHTLRVTPGCARTGRRPGSRWYALMLKHTIAPPAASLLCILSV